jgi:hemerythrin-like metal-binding protein
MMILTTLLIGALLVGALITFIVLGPTNFVPWLFVLATVGVVAWAKFREKSKFLVWKDEYSVGIEAIDQDHRKLLNLINQFQTAVLYRTGREFEEEAFDALVDYTRTHFRREEDLMEKYGYPDFEGHRDQHRKMIAQVEACMAQYTAEGRQVPLERAVAFLQDWLITHINGTDQQYSEFLRDKGVR